MIHVYGLTKDYSTRRAIENLNFHVSRGEVLGFLGPNGAGKTTSMRILTGTISPSQGTATVAGFDVVSESLDVRQRVGYLPESTPLYPDMTVIEYLRYMADLRSLPDPEIRIAKVIALVDLEDGSRNRIGTLSKEKRRRIGIAQAIFHDPEVVVLDEPTGGLKPRHRPGIRQLIANISKERTVILSTQTLSEVHQICDRVLIIHQGQIVAEDYPERLQARVVGAKRSILSVRGDGAGLPAMIQAVPGVTQVSVLEEGKVEFTTAPGRDIRPQIARTLIEAGYDLLELRSLADHLEEVFLELNRDELTEPDAVGRDETRSTATMLEKDIEG